MMENVVNLNVLIFMQDLINGSDVSVRYAERSVLYMTIKADMKFRGVQTLSMVYLYSSGISQHVLSALNTVF